MANTSYNLNFWKFLEKIESEDVPFVFDFTKYAYEKDPLYHLFEAWKPYYNMKYHLCKFLAPTSILEIGVRYGYSAVAFMNAVPKAKYIGIDNESADPGGVLSAVEYARELLKEYNAEIIIDDTQLMDRFPGDVYDLIHVDEQQNGDSTFHDLELALGQGRYILVDGYFWSNENMLAATYFMQKYKEFIHYSTIIPGYAGELLIKVKRRYSKQKRSYMDLSGDYNSKYYLTDCGGYDAFLKSDGRQLDSRLGHLVDLLADINEKNVLDIGCGRGELTNHLYEMGANAVGVDYSQDAIDIARSTFAQNLGNKLQYLCEDILAFQEQEKYHRIIMADVVEHIEQNSLDKLLGKIRAILNTNGYVLIHTAPNKLYYDIFYAEHVRKVRELGVYIPSNPRSYYEDLMHINEQTAETMQKALEKHFEHVVVWTAPFQDKFWEYYGKDCPYEIASSHFSIYAVAAKSSEVLMEFTSLIDEIKNYKLDRDDVDIEIRASYNTFGTVSVWVRNNGNKTIRQYADSQVNIAYHIIDCTGNIIVWDGERTKLIHDLPKNGGVLEQSIIIDYKSLPKDKEYKVVITLVQEGLFWFDDIDKRFSCEIKLKL